MLRLVGPLHYLFTGTREHVSDCAGGRYATICERRRGSSAYRRPGTTSIRAKCCQ